MKIEVIDTFNSRTISAHRTLAGAVKSQRRHLAAVQRRNGGNSYLTYAFRFADGSPVPPEEITQARMDLDRAKP